MRTYELSGEYTDDAIVYLPEDKIEDNCKTQLEKMVNTQGFTDKIRVMPDCHKAKASTIGFTMPVDNKVIPNVIGVDTGCGVEAACLGDTLPKTGDALEKLVRDKTPMGWGTEGMHAPDREYYHVHRDFPFDTATENLRTFISSVDAPFIPYMEDFLENGAYNPEYFDELASERAGSRRGWFNERPAINALGTLGSGNHFIEFGQSTTTGKYWVSCHSGSRKLGGLMTEYWQNKAITYAQATDAREHFNQYPNEYFTFDLETINDTDLIDWVYGAKGESFINYDAIPKLERETIKDELLSVKSDTGLPDTDESMDYLEGELAAGYLIDMIFCQVYAEENRRMILETILDALAVEPEDWITSTHNYIDSDGIIRKGATRAYENERLLIPFNMRDGILICEGKSNADWNFSGPHGGGRQMSRGEARETFSEEDAKTAMDGIEASATPVDEHPESYKPPALIESMIEPTVSIVDRIKPVHSFKADD